MGIKVYARQVSVECQESPICLFGELPEGIAITGNRHFLDICPDWISTAKSVLNNPTDISEAVIDALNDKDWYDSAEQAIFDFLDRVKSEYSEDTIMKIAHIFYDSEDSYYDEDTLCHLLSLLSGDEYDCCCIRGCCQGDWNYIYYPKNKYSDIEIRHIECEYFNTGSEWILNEDFYADITEPDEISGYSVYVHEYGYDNIKAEIKSMVESCEGVDVDEVILFEHSGYTRISNYTRV